ncbi:MAG TPA: hypothetical protein PLJ21_13825, partial [Pseudobdellovibrionaceae bacterium]|nr:hypothetical protein [Pseudobdellovibrionaceae bacterium]
MLITTYPLLSLKKTTELQTLWDKIQERFAPLIKFEPPLFNEFRPHVTDQGDNKILPGDEVSIKALSLVK